MINQGLIITAKRLPYANIQMMQIDCRISFFKICVRQYSTLFKHHDTFHNRYESTNDFQVSYVEPSVGTREIRLLSHPPKLDLILPT